jgi:hypothetical protein
MTNLEHIHNYFKDYESPAHFITWIYYYGVTSCLGRRIWTQGDRPIYANQQIIIVGPPAIGKSMPATVLCNKISSLVRIDERNIAHDLVNIVPNCITLEKLYSVMERAGTALKLPSGKPYFHSSASFMLADEMGLLFKDKQQIKNLVMFLNGGYDCMEKFTYDTKNHGTNQITNMCVNFFGCCTPNWVSENITSGLIDDGWTSRVIWLWGEEKRQLTTFIKLSEDQKKSFDEVAKHFGKLALVSGECILTKEAEDFFHHWYHHVNDKTRINKDGKLDNYYGRKKVHALKMAMIIHFSERLDLVITVDDIKRALEVLGEAELNMHKALASVNSNPAARLAEGIKKDLSQSKEGMTRAEIIAKHFTNGGLQSIDEVLEYLRIAGVANLGAGGKYSIVKKIIPFEDCVKQQALSAAEIKDTIIKEASVAL